MLERDSKHIPHFLNIHQHMMFTMQCIQQCNFVYISSRIQNTFCIQKAPFTDLQKSSPICDSPFPAVTVTHFSYVKSFLHQSDWGNPVSLISLTGEGKEVSCLHEI